MFKNIFYSSSTGGFYPLDLFKKDEMPSDAIEIPIETYEEMMSGQELGMEISPSPSSSPLLSTPLISNEDWARSELKDADDLIAPLTSEAISGVISPEDKIKWMGLIEFRKKVAAWQEDGFAGERPDKPE